MKKYYAKAKITHGDFIKNNLYEVIVPILHTDIFLEVKLKDKAVIVKRDNFTIVDCLFNEEKAG